MENEAENTAGTFTTFWIIRYNGRSTLAFSIVTMNRLVLVHGPYHKPAGLGKRTVLMQAKECSH